MNGLKPTKARSTIFNTSMSELMVILIFILLMLFISKIYQQSENIKYLNEKLVVQEEVLANVIPLSLEQESDDLLERMRNEIEKRSKSKDFTGDKLLNKFRIEIARLKRENSIQEQLSEREKDDLYQKNCVLALNFYNKNNRIPLSEDSPLNKENNLIVNNILLAQTTEINLAGDGNQYDNRLTYNAKGIGKDRFFDSKNIEFRKSNNKTSNQRQGKDSNLPSKNNLAQTPSNVLKNSARFTKNISSITTNPTNRDSYISEIEKRKLKGRDSKDYRYLQSLPKNKYALNSDQKNDLRTIKDPSKQYEMNRINKVSSPKNPYKNRIEERSKIKPDNRITKIQNNLKNRPDKQTKAQVNSQTKPTKSKASLVKTNKKSGDRNNKKIDPRKEFTLPKNTKIATLIDPSGQKNLQNFKKRNKAKNNLNPIQNNNETEVQTPSPSSRNNRDLKNASKLSPKLNGKGRSSQKNLVENKPKNSIKSNNGLDSLQNRNQANLNKPENNQNLRNIGSSKNQLKPNSLLNAPNVSDSLVNNIDDNNLNSDNGLNTGQDKNQSNLNTPENNQGLNNNQTSHNRLKPSNQLNRPNGIDTLANNIDDNNLNPLNQQGKDNETDSFANNPSDLTDPDIQFNPDTGLEPRIEKDILNSIENTNQQAPNEKPSTAPKNKSIFDRIADLFNDDGAQPNIKDVESIPLEFKPSESNIPSIIEDEDEFDSFVFIQPEMVDTKKPEDDKKKDKTSDELKKELIALLDSLADFIENPEESNKDDVAKALSRINEIKNKISDLKKESERNACKLEP